MAGRMVCCNNTINFILPKGSLDDSKYQSRYDLIQKGAFIKIFIFRKAEQKLCFSTYAYVNFHHFCPNNFFLRLEQYFPHHTILNRKLCLQSCTHFFRLWVRNYVWYQIISTFLVKFIVRSSLSSNLQFLLQFFLLIRHFPLCCLSLSILLLCIRFFLFQFLLDGFWCQRFYKLYKRLSKSP